MSEAHSDQLTLLLSFAFVIIIAIFVPIVYSSFKKKKDVPGRIVSVEKDEHGVNKVSYEDTQTTFTQTNYEIAAAKLQAREATNLEVPPPPPPSVEKEKTVAEALAKTEENFFGRIRKAFSSGDKKQVLEQVEEVLYTSDLGPKTVEVLMEKIQDELSGSELTDINKVKTALRYQMTEILGPVHQQQKNSHHLMDLVHTASQGPTVLMIVGVNGAGKTTSIGKMTAQLAQAGKKVLVAAGDTFRAAAGGQLKVWTERAQTNSASGGGQVEIFWPDQVTDPGAVAFDAVAKAKAQNFDYVILDTAGRLHTQGHLMEELKKVKRVMMKVIPESPHETWIVLDANSGQNALNQAVEFNKAMELTGVILTKMDGTAKGGVALGVVNQLQKPIKLIGIGEKIQDLRVFNQDEYIQSILG